MVELSLFEYVTRYGVTFPSAKGDLVVEQVWKLPLKAKRTGELDLDTLARAYHKELEDLGTRSFVDDAAEDPRKILLTNRFQAVIRIIAVLKAEKAAVLSALAIKEQIAQLEQQKLALQKRELDSLDKDQVAAQLKALNEQLAKGAA